MTVEASGVNEPIQMFGQEPPGGWRFARRMEVGETSLSEVQKLVTKIESRNAFVPCAHPDHPHACVFFICENCGTSEEIEDSHLEQLFDRKANSLGFRVSKRVLELQGVCASCLGETPSTSAAAVAL